MKEMKKQGFGNAGFPVRYVCSVRPVRPRRSYRFWEERASARPCSRASQPRYVRSQELGIRSFFTCPLSVFGTAKTPRTPSVERSGCHPRFRPEYRPSDLHLFSIDCFPLNSAQKFVATEKDIRWQNPSSKSTRWPPTLRSTGSMMISP